MAGSTQSSTLTLHDRRRGDPTFRASHRELAKDKVPMLSNPSGKNLRLLRWQGLLPTETLTGRVIWTLGQVRKKSFIRQQTNPSGQVTWAKTEEDVRAEKIIDFAQTLLEALAYLERCLHRADSHQRQDALKNYLAQLNTFCQDADPASKTLAQSFRTLRRQKTRLTGHCTVKDLGQPNILKDFLTEEITDLLSCVKSYNWLDERANNHLMTGDVADAAHDALALVQSHTFPLSTPATVEHDLLLPDTETLQRSITREVPTSYLQTLQQTSSTSLASTEDEAAPPLSLDPYLPNASFEDLFLIRRFLKSRELPTPEELPPRPWFSRVFGTGFKLGWGAQSFVRRAGVACLSGLASIADGVMGFFAGLVQKNVSICRRWVFNRFLPDVPADSADAAEEREWLVNHRSPPRTLPNQLGRLVSAVALQAIAAVAYPLFHVGRWVHGFFRPSALSNPANTTVTMETLLSPITEPSPSTESASPDASSYRPLDTAHDADVLDLATQTWLFTAGSTCHFLTKYPSTALVLATALVLVSPSIGLYAAKTGVNKAVAFLLKQSPLDRLNSVHASTLHALVLRSIDIAHPSQLGSFDTLAALSALSSVEALVPLQPEWEDPNYCPTMQRQQSMDLQSRVTQELLTKLGDQLFRLPAAHKTALCQHVILRLRQEDPALVDWVIAKCFLKSAPLRIPFLQYIVPETPLSRSIVHALNYVLLIPELLLTGLGALINLCRGKPATRFILTCLKARVLLKDSYQRVASSVGNVLFGFAHTALAILKTPLGFLDQCLNWVVRPAKSSGSVHTADVVRRATWNAAPLNAITTLSSTLRQESGLEDAQAIHGATFQTATPVRQASSEFSAEVAAERAAGEPGGSALAFC